jgi:hypothetical protein
MRSRAFLWVLAVLLGFSLVMGEAATASTQNQQTAKEKEMKEKRRETADRIITKMMDDGASKTDIEIQMQTNKKMFGYEGEYKENRGYRSSPPTIKTSPLHVTVAPPEHMMKAGEDVTTTAKVLGGVPPYTYQWFNNDKQSKVTKEKVRWTMRQGGTHILKVIVKDSQGNTAQAQSSAVVQAITAPKTKPTKEQKTKEPSCIGPGCKWCPDGYVSVNNRDPCVRIGPK